MRQRSRRACAVAQCAPAVSDSQGNRLDTAVSDSQGNRLVRDTGRASAPPCLQPCVMRVCTLMYMRVRLYLPAAAAGAPCRTPSHRRRGRPGVAAAPAQGPCPCGDIRGLWASESGRLACLPRCPRLLRRPCWRPSHAERSLEARAAGGRRRRSQGHHPAREEMSAAAARSRRVRRPCGACCSRSARQRGCAPGGWI